jgi:hypothetical protein
MAHAGVTALLRLFVVFDYPVDDLVGKAPGAAQTIACASQDSPGVVESESWKRSRAIAS